MRKSYPIHHRSFRHTSTLGTLIKQRRESLGLSQSSLATKAELSHTTLSRLEAGKVLRPSPNVLGRLATALGIGPEDLFAAAGHVMPDQLPDYLPYLQARHAYLPPEAILELQQHFDYVLSRYKADDSPSDS